MYIYLRYIIYDIKASVYKIGRNYIYLIYHENIDKNQSRDQYLLPNFLIQRIFNSVND